MVPVRAACELQRADRLQRADHEAGAAQEEDDAEDRSADLAQAAVERDGAPDRDGGVRDDRDAQQQLERDGGEDDGEDGQKDEAGDRLVRRRRRRRRRRCRSRLAGRARRTANWTPTGGAVPDARRAVERAAAAAAARTDDLLKVERRRQAEDAEVRVARERGVGGARGVGEVEGRVRRRARDLGEGHRRRGRRSGGVGTVRPTAVPPLPVRQTGPVRRWRSGAADRPVRVRRRRRRLHDRPAATAAAI